MRTNRLIFTVISIATLALAGCGGDDDGGDDTSAQIDANPNAVDANPNAPDAAAPDAAANSVACGQDTCDLSLEPPEQCCVDQGTATCTTEACAGTTLGCDGPEDCPADLSICCVHIGGQNAEIECAATCDNGVSACHFDTDCAEGEHCCGSETYKVCVAAPSCP